MFFRTHAGSGVLYYKGQPIAVIAYDKWNASGIRELDGIAQQVVAYLYDALLVAIQDNTLRALDGKFKIFCFCLLRKLRLQQLRDVFQTKRTDIRLFLAAVQAEEVKQGVEHVGHSLGGLQDIVRITAYLFFFVVLHQFRISMYGSQWCA